MIKLLLTITLTIATATSLCGAGCLKCAIDQNCLLCDTTEGYYLSSGNCLKSSQKNCLKLSLTGACLICDKNYYPDPQTKKCVVVDSTHLTTFCAVYNEAQVCIGCESNFYINNGNCVQVTNPIAFCDQNNANICLTCQNGYYLSQDGSSCLILPSQANCSSYSKYSCKECKNGFVKNKNLYFLTNYDNENFMLIQLLHQKLGLSTLQNHNVCQKVLVSNCLEYADYNKCLTCLDGFYFSDSKCLLNPFDKITNCEKYTSQTICQKCQQGYYLNNNKCVQVTDVSGCSIYNQITNTCSQCNTDHYLSGDNCLIRVNSLNNKIPFCKTKQIDADKCSECLTGFNISQDGLKCFTNIHECKIYNATSSTSDQTTCETCNNGFYLSVSSCLQGSDLNCLVFQKNNDVCATCKVGYYLSGNQCLAHLQIQNCDVYSQSQKNNCLTCKNNTYNFQIEKYCKVKNVIPFCKTYDHSTTQSPCQKCEQGYKLNGSFQCQALATPHCLIEDNSDNCIKCQKNYGLFKHGTTVECQLPHEFLTDDCEEVKTQDSNEDPDEEENTYELKNVTCKACKQNSFSIDLDNAYACIKDDYLKVNGIEISTKIDNCLKMEDNTNCVQCKDGYYLHTNACRANGCSSSGTPELYAAVVLYPDTAPTPDEYFIEKQSICNESTSDNDLVTAYDLENPAPGNEITIKCLSSKPTVIDDLTDTKYTNVNPDGSFNNWIQSPVDIFPKVTCPTTTTSINGDSTAPIDLVQNCQYYFQHGVTANEIGCLKCKHGYTGVSHADGYIQSCSNNNSCQTTTIYKNLDVYWSRLLSCHKCSNNQKIPYIAYLTSGTASADITKFKQFTLQDTANKGDWYTNIATIENGNVNLCIDNNSKTGIRNDLNLEATINDSAIEFVANCGIGLLNLSYAGTAFDSSEINEDAPADLKQTILCGACKPGYKAEFQTDTKFVKTCTEIDFCKNSEWFNACSQCDTDYVHKFDSVIKFEECVKYNKDANCYAYDDGSNECKVCNRGYFLNEDKYCEQVTPNRCQTNKYVPYQTFPHNSDLKYHLYANSQGIGCNECQSGYTAFKYDSSPSFAQYVCAKSNYVQQNQTNFPKQSDDNDSNYINNCKNYFNKSSTSTTILCSECDSNYVKRQNNQECLLLSLVQNCLEAQNTENKCQKCQKGYSLLSGGTCSLGNISQCLEYNTDTFRSEITCTKCSPGFYLDLNQCKKGIIEHCKEYDNAKDKCDVCEDNYHKISYQSLSGNHDYCYAKDSTLNCKTATIQNNATLGAQFECTECNEAHQQLTQREANQNQTDCLFFNLINQCEKYDLKSQLNLTSFTCVKCNSSYYYSADGFSCIQRVNLTEGCTKYQDAADKCELCDTNFYLTQDGKQCKTFPNGINGCRVYQDAETCISCVADHYLDNNKCVEVPQNNKIPGCLYYQSSISCHQCKHNFYLSSNTSCQQVIALECLKVKSIDACESCNQGFVLKQQNGVVNCVSHAKPHCAVFSQIGSYECLQCNQNYYIDSNGNCQTANHIFNCLENESLTTCKQCGENFALSADKKSCVDKLVYLPNCQETFIPQQLECSQCDAGHFFELNQCKAFVQNSIGDGCFNSSPFDNTECFFCNSGYFMKSSKVCQKIVTNNGGPNNQGYDGLEMIVIVNLFVMLFFQQVNCIYI